MNFSDSVKEKNKLLQKGILTENLIFLEKVRMSLPKKGTFVLEHRIVRLSLCKSLTEENRMCKDIVLEKNWDYGEYIEQKRESLEVN